MTGTRDKRSFTAVLMPGASPGELSPTSGNGCGKSVPRTAQKLNPPRVPIGFEFNSISSQIFLKEIRGYFML
jgi:hypothetical protein